MRENEKKLPVVICNLYPFLLKDILILLILYIVYPFWSFGHLVVSSSVCNSFLLSTLVVDVHYFYYIYLMID